MSEIPRSSNAPNRVSPSVPMLDVVPDTATETFTVARCDCGGRLVVCDTDSEIWEIECDDCDWRGAAARTKIDPGRRRRDRVERANLPAGFVGQRYEQTNENKSTIMLIGGWLRDYAAWREENRRKRQRDRARPPAAPALWGEQGRGKTHLLVALCIRLIEECDVDVVFRPTRQLLRELQRFDDDVQRGESWRRAISCDVLALDDLGGQQASDWKLDQIAELIDERYQRQLPILLTTNFPPAAWEQIVDLRTVSRLRALTFPVQLRGSDRRQLALTQPTLEDRSIDGTNDE